MPKIPLENSRTKSLETPGSLSDIKPCTNVVKDIRNFASETSNSSTKETSAKRSNSFPYTHMTEDGRIVEEWIEVKSPPKQSDQSSKETRNAKDVRSPKLSPGEIARDDLTPDQQRIYERLFPEHQREPALKEVLHLRSKREHDAKAVAHAEHLVSHYASIEKKVNKEIDHFKKEYISIFGKEGDKLSKGQKELSPVEFLAAYKQAEATGRAGYGKADQSKAMFTEAADEIYQKSAAAHEAVSSSHSQLLRQERHLHDSQSAYAQAKEALSPPQRKALSEAKARAERDLGQGEKKSADTSNSALEDELTATRTRLREGIAAAKKKLSEAEDKLLL